MTKFVRTLSDHAKSKRSDFKIYVNNAESLLKNAMYLNSIDGLLKENLYYSDFGQKQPEADTNWSRQHLNMAKAAGKNVSVIEYVSDPAKIADVRKRAGADGYGFYTTNIDLKGINVDGFVPIQPTAPVPPSSSPAE
jgi:cysteinyl-tRNA synthetase